MTVFRWRLHKVTFWEYVCHILLHSHCLDWHTWSCQGSLVGNLVLSATVLRWWPLKKVGLSRRSLKEPLFGDWRSLTEFGVVNVSFYDIRLHSVFCPVCFSSPFFFYHVLMHMRSHQAKPVSLLDLNIQPIKLKLNKSSFLIKNSDLFIWVFVYECFDCKYVCALCVCDWYP